MSDRLSRAERRNLQRLDAEILPRPLPMTQDPRPVAAHIRHVVKLLRTPQSKSPCSDAIAHVTGLFDRTVPERANKMIACSKGCSYCCTQMVVLTAPEAFFVAAQIRHKKQTVAAILEAAAQVGALSLDERLKAKVFCPLLENALCSIYAARPLGCHGFVSTNLDACLATFTRGEAATTSMPSDTINVLYAVRMLLTAALRLASLDHAHYEMLSALAVILTQENAEARWLAGENILVAVKPGPPAPAQFEQVISQLVAFTAPTV